MDDFADRVKEIDATAFRHEWIRASTQHYTMLLRDISRQWILDNLDEAYHMLPQLQAYCYIQLQEDFNFTDKQLDRMRAKLTNSNWTLASFDKAKVVRNQYFKTSHYPTDASEMYKHALHQSCSCEVVIRPPRPYKRNTPVQQARKDAYNLKAGAQQLAALRAAKLRDLGIIPAEKCKVQSVEKCEEVPLPETVIEKKQIPSLTEVLEQIKFSGPELKTRMYHIANQRWLDELTRGCEIGIYTYRRSPDVPEGYHASIVIFAPPGSGKTSFARSGPWYDTRFIHHWTHPDPDLILTDDPKYLIRGRTCFALIPDQQTYLKRYAERGHIIHPSKYSEVFKHLPRHCFVIRTTARLAEVLSENGT